MNEWRLFICTNCDTDEGVVIHQVPEEASWEAGCNVDYCPGCGSYLSLMSVGKIEVAVTPGHSYSLTHREPAEA